MSNDMLKPNPLYKDSGEHLWFEPDILLPASTLQLCSVLLLGWDTCTTQYQDQPCLTITKIYDVLSNVGVGQCLGGAVIITVECVRGWLSLDGGVKREETLTVSVSPQVTASTG